MTVPDPAARPIAQTLIRSLITGLLLAQVGGWLHALTEDITKWKVGFAIFAGGALITWLILQIPRRQVLRSPGTVRRESSLRLAIDWNDGQTGSFSNHKISEQQFISWSIGVDSGISLGETHWTGEGAPFSKSQYILFRDQLLARGFIRKRGDHYTRGFELTEKGAAMCREVVRRYTPHPDQTPHCRADLIPVFRSRE